MVENDYVMRIIHEMVRTLIKLIFGIDEVKEEELEFEAQESGDLFRRLREMAKDGKINEAENLLSDVLDEQETGSLRLEYMKVALFFYDYLNGKSNEFLENCDYSREEIREGIRSTMIRYGYEELAETWGDQW